MKEHGSSTAYNTHNTTLLIHTLKYVSDILQTEEAFTVEKYKHTHTHTANTKMSVVGSWRSADGIVGWHSWIYKIEKALFIAVYINQLYEVSAITFYFL